jgi:hypothetical protein
MAPVDRRGELGSNPFSYRTTKDGRVLISRGGKQIVVVAGKKADRLRAELAAATEDLGEQLLLAKVTGNYRHGNER